MTRTLAILLLLYGQHATSLPCSTANSQFKDMPRLAQRVAVVGKSERMLAAAYAKKKKVPVSKVVNAYAPTGDVKCGGIFWGGQLTKKDDIVTSAGHAFYNDDCSPIWPNVHECRFLVDVNGKQKEYEIDYIQATGRLCNRVPFKSKDDWVVLKLKEHVPLKPYRVDQAETDRAMAKGGNLVAVGKSSDFYQRQGNKTVLPKHYGDCQTNDQGTGSHRGSMVTDCDSAETSSGSSRLNDDMNDPALVGIHSKGPETRADLERAWKNGKPNTGDYDRLDWSTVVTPVSGELLQILNAL